MVLHSESLGTQTTGTVGRSNVAKVGEETEEMRYVSSNLATIPQPSGQPPVDPSPQQLPPPPPPPPFSPNSLHPVSVGGYYWPLNTALNQPHAFKQIQQCHSNTCPFDTSEFL
ncbi:unnamed protein product [Hydatigera taeniaeformis]|uniref:Uncharacterized protein n=1 Tax=Hydatigena taeniaeformis TaxID=6205 RepID=A0A0R3X9R6_HYDTA|nr:unnamed protein product [Hydatigera taeniaeformis]